MIFIVKSLLVFAFTWTSVSGSVIAPYPFIVNQGVCYCVVAGTSCTGGSTGIDIRIVNNGTPLPSCQANSAVCCFGVTPTTTTTTASPPASGDASCGLRKITPTTQPVVGQAAYGAYPWQVQLLNRNEASVGSGVLLDASHVLTAAHKVAAYANNPGGLLARVGSWVASGNQAAPYNFITVNVARVTLHPSFNPTNLENDLAVVKLNGVVPIASYPNINTACKPNGAPVTGQRCYVSGWGLNQFGPGGSYPSLMREVDVPILDGTDCENRLKQTRLGAAFTLNRNSFVCAGGEAGKDACTGDGGSPLVCQRPNGQFQVTGIVAWGIGCASPGVPGVYVNVHNYVAWIDQTLAIP